MSSRSFTDAVQFGHALHTERIGALFGREETRKLTEPFGGMRKLTEPFGGAHKLSESFGGMRKLTEPFGGMRKLTEPFGGAHKLSESFGGMRELTEPFGGMRKLTEPFGGMRELTEPFGGMRKLTEPFGGAALFGMGEAHKLAESFGAGEAVAGHLRQFERFNAGLSGVLNTYEHSAWSAHLQATAIPTLSLLGQEWAKPVGFLTELPDSNLGASIAWLKRHREEPLVMLAALVPEDQGRRGVEVIVEGGPICAICDGPLRSLGDSVKLLGPGRGIRRTRIFPVCSTCFVLEQENPGMLAEALANLNRPALRVLHGGRRGDGVKRGVLRIVRIDDDDDS